MQTYAAIKEAYGVKRCSLAAPFSIGISSSHKVGLGITEAEEWGTGGSVYRDNGEYLRPWSSWTANSDKKYMELNGATLDVNKPCVISQKTAFPTDK